MHGSIASRTGAFDSLAEIYRKSTLDCIIELAAAAERVLAPQPGVVANGPSLTERTRAYAPFIDPFLGKAVDNICFSELGLRRAATEWLHASEAGRPAVEAALHDAAETFAANLAALAYLPEQETVQAALKQFDAAVALLHTPEVASRFNTEIPNESWPLVHDVNGSFLLSRISRELVPESATGVTVAEFDALQTLANARAETIRKLEHREALDELAVAAYRWQETVNQLQMARAVRLWRDVSYSDLIQGIQSGFSPGMPPLRCPTPVAEWDLARLAAGTG